MRLLLTATVAVAKPEPITGGGAQIQRPEQAMFVSFFFIMVFFLMGGLFTPVDSMPDWAKAITIANPLKYFIDVMRLVYLKGSKFADMIPQFLALCGFAVAFGGWAIISYKKSS